MRAVPEPAVLPKGAINAGQLLYRSEMVKAEEGTFQFVHAEFRDRSNVCWRIVLY